MARAVRVRRSAPQRRKLVWARQANPGASVAAGQGEHFNANILAPFRTQMGATLPGITIMRVRLEWTVQTGVEGRSQAVVAGIRRFTQSPDDANALLDVDSPVADPHADWMMYDAWLHNEEDISVTQRSVDVKSMRKLDEVSDSLVLSFGCVDELATQVSYVCSVLVALP